MPKGKKNKGSPPQRSPPPPPPPAERTASPPPMRIAFPPPPPPHAERTASLPPTPVDLHLTPFEWLNSWPRIRIPDWEELTHDLLHDHQPTFWGSILLALWGLGMDGDKPIDGSVLAVRFNDDATIQVFTGDPGDPRPSWLSAAPPEPPPPSPAPLPPQPLGFSPINTVFSEDLGTENPPAASAPAPPPNQTKKRKGKMPSNQDAYAIKCQLSDREAKKIAATDPVDTPAGSTPATTQYPKPPTPEPSTSHPRPRTSTPLPKARSRPPTCPDNTTSRQGIVVHGIALRKDLGNVRRWLEASKKDIGKTTGIRWLRKKTILTEEGKVTSSVVVYLEKPTDIGKVRLGGRWLRANVYETERGRK
ncbi:hypothetical protein BDZ91DRAFT_804024 [Kalaharituber pfeilii]|nr:hypothetical protein BDZ91DRAFT_804024 [Kalaharituber pfeilii]